jgi:hypothetical protein
MKWSRYIILAFVILASGCNTIGLVYRNADVYLQHKINGYTSFNDLQKEQISTEVANYMLWHRTVALPEYIKFLQNLNGAAQYRGQLNLDVVARLRSQLLGLYRTAMARAIGPTAQLLSQLDNSQIDELEKNLAEQIQKQRLEQLGGDAGANLKRRADRTIAFLEWLAGNLSDEQQQAVATMSRDLPFVNSSYIDFRETNQHRLVTLLKERPGPKAIESFLSSWILTPEMLRTPQEQKAIRSFEAATDQMVTKVHMLLTPQQKEHIQRLITSYVNEMRKISQSGGAASGGPQ